MPRGSMLPVAMEPASTAVLPATHRFRRRDAARRCPPTRPRGLITRPRLVRRLSEAREAQFVLLVAPAGYGKTTLLSEWAACDGRRFAWIDMGAGENDSDRLLAAVKRTVHDGQAPTVLVVDNAHLVSTPETMDALHDLARAMPSGSQLALASRSEPELPIGSLRADRRIVELRAGDMAMTRSEAGALLAAAGIRVASGGLDTLMDRTEGWPAGLYLAALSLRAQPNVDGALSRFAGDDQVVADYLRDELLAQLEPDQLTFLLRTSVLGTLSGSLCDAVLDEAGSARTLGELARSNVLLVSLDRGGTEYQAGRGRRHLDAGGDDAASRARDRRLARGDHARQGHAAVSALRNSKERAVEPPNEPAPAFRAPPLACDAHFHVFGPAERYPYGGERPRSCATRRRSRRSPTISTLASHLGIERFVFVQPSAYGRDNACMLDAMREVGIARCRGIVDVDENAPDALLAEMDKVAACAACASMSRR